MTHQKTEKQWILSYLWIDLSVVNSTVFGNVWRRKANEKKYTCGLRDTQTTVIFWNCILKFIINPFIVQIFLSLPSTLYIDFTHHLLIYFEVNTVSLVISTRRHNLAYRYMSIDRIHRLRSHLLLLHGSNDFKIPIENSEMLYIRALSNPANCPLDIHIKQQNDSSG